MNDFFENNLSAAAFTSENVMNNSLEIIYVSHNDDGSWEFWGNEFIDENEIKLVSLNNILSIDPSIKSISNLESGYSASRENKYSPWVIIKNEEE